MRKTRFFIMIFVLVGIMFVLSGCGAYYSTDFDFYFHGDYMADKYVDLLIPIDENDEFYTPYNSYIENDIEIPEDSEIVNYNKDGYRSMLIHMNKSDLDISMKDSEGYYDTQEEYNGTPSEIHQWVWFPPYHMSESEERFLEFCNKYKKCYIAVFDGNGNIVQISKKIPLVSLGNFYLQDISYNVEKNKIKPYYIESWSLKSFFIEVWLLSLAGMIGCIITLSVGNLNQNRPIISYKGYEYIIASAIFNIPAVLLIMIDIYCILGKSMTIEKFLITLPTILIDMGVLIHFIRLEKKLHMKKILTFPARYDTLFTTNKEIIYE